MSAQFLVIEETKWTRIFTDITCRC